MFLKKTINNKLKKGKMNKIDMKSFIKITILVFISILLFFNIKNYKKQNTYLNNINSLNEELNSIIQIK